MTKMAMNPRNFNASSGLSKLRYHLSPQTFFVVVVFIFPSVVALFVRIVLGFIVAWRGNKSFSICVLLLFWTLQFGLGV